MGATLATAVVACVLSPAAGAADWLPTFDLDATGVSQVDMTQSGDIAFTLSTSGGPALRFRPAGGPLGPPETPFPAGAQGGDTAMDAQGNTYLVWTRGSTVETRVRRRDGSLSDIQTVQGTALAPKIDVSPSGRATIAWISGDASHAGSARTRDTDGTLGAVQPVTVLGEKTRNLEVAVDDAGDATFVWTTPDAPPNTRVKGRTLSFASQALSTTVYDVSGAPAGLDLFDESQVAVDPLGNATFVWRHAAASPPAGLIETRTLSAAGTLGIIQPLTGGHDSQGHAVGVDGTGRARVVWVERAGSTDPFLPRTCFNAVGSTCGAAAPLSSSPSLSTRLAVGPAGHAMVGLASPAGQMGVVVVLPPGAGVASPGHVLSPTASLPEVAVDAAGNGVAVWKDGDAIKGSGYDAVPPVIQSVSIPPVIERGVPAAASVSVLDVWGAAGTWSFGDGGTADGLSVQHAFQRTGTFPVQITTTDGVGASMSATRQVTVRDTRAPSLGRVIMRRTRFRVARSATPVSARKRRRPPPRGSDFRFALGEDAVVTIAIERRTVGRKVGRRCRRARGPVPRRRRCTRYASAGPSLLRNLAAGDRRVSFSGRIRRKALKPAPYRATLRAADSSRNTSALRRVSFTIVR